MSATVAFTTLGCRLNQADTQAMQARLEGRGFRTVPLEAAPDVVIVNTCTVTARAELSDKRAIRRAARLSPHGRVVVTGCWAQTSPGEVAALGGVDLVVGNADKARLPDLLEQLATAATPRIEVSDIAAARIDTPGAAQRARQFVKVQDGCQHRCAFCVVPLARGASRSLPPAVAEDHVRRLVDAGHPEVVLTGVDLGHYGADLSPRTSLAALLARLVTISGLRWLRLSSMLPAYFTDDVLELVTTSPVIAPHLHLPLQSGSDRVLRAMRRPYTVTMYRTLVERLAAAMPRMGLGADVIVGFPGESEADFAETVALVEALPFSYLHVFPYSARPGTGTAAEDPVPPQVKKERSARLRAASHAACLAHWRSKVGCDDVVLVDRPGRGYGDDYSPWLVPESAPVGELLGVRGAAVREEGILAA